MITDIPLSWLKQKGTAEEFERERLDRMAAITAAPLEKIVAKFGARPMGDLTEKWAEFVGRLGEGDELWSFSAPEKMTSAKMGCWGFAIVRAGEIRDVLVVGQT